MRSAGNFNSEWGYLAPAPSFMRTARVVLVATAIGATAGAAVVVSLIDRPAVERDKTASIAAHAIVTSVQAAPASATPSPGSAAVAPAAPVSVTTAVPVTAAPVAQVQPATPMARQVARQVVPQATPQTAPQVEMPPPPAATPSTAIASPRPSAINPPVSENSGAGDASAAPVSKPVMSKPVPGIASLSDVPAATEAAPVEAPDEALIPPQTVPPEKKPKHHAAYASNGKSKPAAGIGTVLRRLFSPHTGTSYYPGR